MNATSSKYKHFNIINDKTKKVIGTVMDSANTFEETMETEGMSCLYDYEVDYIVKVDDSNWSHRGILVVEGDIVRSHDLSYLPIL